MGNDKGKNKGRGGERISLTPLVETQIVSDEWSNMRIWNGSVISNALSSRFGGGAPSGLNGPIGTADVRMRAGTLLGNVTTEDMTVTVSVVSSVIASVAGITVSITVTETTSLVFSTVVRAGTTYVVVTVA